MAIAVPMLLANTAAGAAIAGAVGVSVGTLAVATSVVFQVTGVNDKINKAASKVFGEDLVKVANIAGAAYGAFNGGFSLDPAKEFIGGIGSAASGAEAATAMNVPTGMEAGAAFEAQMAGSGILPTSATDAASSTSFNLSKLGAQEVPTSEGLGSGLNSQTNIVTGEVSNGIGADAKSLVSSPAQLQESGAGQSNYALASKQQATSSTATGLRAAGSDATSSGLGLKPPTDALASQPSVFDKVFGKVGDKTVAGLIQGAAAGYSNAQQARLAEERARVNPSTIRGYTYRPTV